MSYIVFDFEAIRDKSVPYEPRADLEWCSQRPAPDMAPELSWVMERRQIDPFPPACHFQIVCGALIFLGKTTVGPLPLGQVVARAKILTGAEPDIIAQFMEVVRRRVTLVSYGGRNWDIPCVQSRGMRYGIDVSDLFSRDYSDRYRGHLHVDLVEHLTNYGAAQRPKMAAAARLVGWPGKIGVDGSQVDQMVAEGRLREVEAYCLQDTTNEAAILLRLDLSRGYLSRGEYREYATALLQLVDEHPDLGLLRSRIDRELFLYCYEPGRAAPSNFTSEDGCDNEDDGESEDVGTPLEIASFRIESSEAAESDLDLHARVIELLLEHRVETNGCDYPAGAFSIFLVVPPREGERVASVTRSVATALGILARSSYRGPGWSWGQPILGPAEEPASAEACDDCSGEHTPDCASQSPSREEVAAARANLAPGIPDERLDLECARNCYKSDFGINPPDWTIEEARAYLAKRPR